MIRYTSTRQMSIEEFKTPFEVKLDKENRWIKLGNSLPWDAMASIYYRTMSADMGAPAIDARIVIGAMIVKHKLKRMTEQPFRPSRRICICNIFLV